MNTKGFKIFSILLASVLILGLVTACSSGGGKEPVKGTPQDKKETLQDQKETPQDKKEMPQDKKEIPVDKEQEAYPVQITDVLGRVVTIEKLPQKIVSITPSSTETLFALGLGEKIVGVSEQCDYPEEAKNKEKLGAFYQPNLERIVAAQPDIIFVGNMIPPEVLEKLEETGMTVVSLEGNNFEQTYQTIIDTGRITGTVEKAEAIVEDMKAKVEKIKDRVKGASKPGCYFVVSHGEWGNYTAGPGSFIDEMIKLAGGNNIAGDLEQPWAEYSLEKLVESDPQVIMVFSNGNPDGLKEETGYKELTAVKEDKVRVVDENLVSRPGPRLVEGLEEVARAIHPELFE